MDSFLTFAARLFSSDYMPHGGCFLWQPALLWLHASSDGLIALAYFSIPLTLLYFLRQRPGLRLHGLILMFGGFILACGATHVLSIWNLWHSTYRLEGVLKAITALLSITTAVATVKLAPAAMKLSTPEESERTTQSLREEIEARKAAEEKLRILMASERLSSEAKLGSYFEAAAQGILAVSSEGRILLVNRRTEEMFGYARAELIGQPLELLLPERYRGQHVGHRSGYFADPRVRLMGAGMDLAGLRKDGSEFPVEIGLSYVETEEGKMALGLVSDITDRKRASDELSRANRELQAGEAKLRSYFEAASQGILAVSSEGRILLVNRRTEEMFGYDRSELIGQHLEMLLPARYQKHHVSHRTMYFSDPRVRPMGVGLDLAGRRKDGTEFPVEIGLSYIESDEGKMALGLVSDITDRKRAADELTRANMELRRSNSELGDFAYVASHDLQEPLRMIASYLQLLDRRYKDQLDTEAHEFIGYAVDGATRMKSLIQDLLSYSRAGTVVASFRPVAAGTLLEHALSNLKVAIDESQAQVTMDTMPEIVADASLFAQIFQNLIGNAMKFHGTDPPLVHVSAAQHGAAWIFSVRDNGIGIDPQHAGRIFRIFERLHSADQYPGTGVGLAITQKIVERHGGTIWFDSQAGMGTTFHFSVPIPESSAVAQVGSGSKT